MNNEVLYWKADTLYKDNNLTEKRIQLCVESECTNFKIDILFTNFQNFVICFEKALKAAFCFKFEDFVFVNFIVKQPINIILSYSDDNEAMKCIKDFNDSHAQFCKNIQSDFVQYYLEIIIVIKKIGMFVMEKQPRKDILQGLL
jgi:hypothetical protein